VIKNLSELKPYKSFLLSRIRDGNPIKSVVNDSLADLKELFSLEDGGLRKVISSSDEVKSGQLAVGYLHYLEEEQAPWTVNSQTVDRINHLILVCRRNRHVAIYLSDTSWRSAIVKKLGKTSAKGLGVLQKIEPGLLNSAFVKGAARTLWLSGTHARTSIKADNKILSGVELQDALDPLADQTYYFTAARCATDFDKAVLAVGTSPRGSRIWMSSSRSWDEFQKAVTAMLKHLEATTKPVSDPIPVVAVSSVQTSKITEAFDLGVIPPELLSDDPSIDEGTREEMEEWAYYSRFKILKSSKANFSAEVELKNSVLGEIEFQMDSSDPDNVKWRLEGTPASGATKDDLAKALAVCRRANWVKIWYESGHTISDGAVFEVRHRDIPFNDFEWVDFSKYLGGGSYKKYNIKREKPTPLNLKTIGNQDSLFCWVKNAWPIAGLGSSKVAGLPVMMAPARSLTSFILTMSVFRQNSL